VPRIEIAAKRAQTGGPIVAAAAVNPSAAAPGFATQFCDVEVDPDTGTRPSERSRHVKKYQRHPLPPA
jgi:CO/xanthine dehydrogenase Mo-binding subunit